jgi:parvulin-like peptidyl-prolyl isomerase
MNLIAKIREAVAANDELIARARLILSEAPYFTYIPEEQYVRLSIEDDMAVLVWPESHSGYYDSCSIEEQSKDFPLELLRMTTAEITIWSAKQRHIYDENQKVEAARQAKVRAEQTRRNELAALAALKAKYEPQQS